MPLWSETVPPGQVGWSGRLRSLQPNVPVHGGQRLAFVLSTTSVQGCYGLETSPANPYADGNALAGPDASTALPRTDVKFRTIVAN